MDLTYNLVNEHINSRLEASIRAIIYSPNEKNQNGFLRELLSSNLLVFSSEIILSNDPRQMHCLSDEEGFSYYRKGTVIPVVQLQDELGNLFLPAYTSSVYMQGSVLSKDFKGINTLSISVLEMAIAANTSKIILNPDTECCIEIDRDLIIWIVGCLKDGNLLSENGFELDSIN